MSSPYQPYPQGQPGGHGQQQSGYGQPGYGQPAGGGGYGQAPYPQSPYPQAPMPQGGWDPAQRAYLQGAPVGFGEAIAEAFKNVFTYNGRASRSAYWWFVLFNAIVIVALLILSIATKGAGFIPLVLWYVVAFFTTLSLAIRRLHDSNRSGFWYFIAFVPFIGGIWLLVLMCLEGTPGPNQYDGYA